MRLALLFSMGAVLPAIVAAQEPNPAVEIPLAPPAYQVFRYDENYSCLSNAANRTNWFDAAKYIPMRADDPLWYLTFGGEVRERFEGNYPLNWGIAGVGSSSYLLQRITFLSDLHLGERVRFFAEGISGLMEGESQPAPPVQQDPIDLNFAFVDVVPFLQEDQRLTLRVGRFGLVFGSGRLVAPRVPVNVDFRFDGFELLYSQPRWEATGFMTQPAADTGYINLEDHSQTFWGLYATHWFDAPHQLGIDFYYLGYDNKRAVYASGEGEEERHSLGTRQFATWNHWDWDSEEILQAGTFGNNPILAWTASLNTGYTFDTTWHPRLGFKADVASGGSSTNGGTLGTFNALYFKSGYFNDANLASPQNVMDVHPNLTFQFTPALEADGGADVFWRYSRNDAAYGVARNIVIPASVSASRDWGTAADLNLTWHIQRHLNFQTSYVHFFAGSFIQQAKGSDLNYVSATLDFLF